jgi:hypothetical protein
MVIETRHDSTRRLFVRDLDAPQQIRIDLVPRLGLGRARTAIERR